ncbi:unnamed protein product [Durusdinium trenchii]|uniref:Uncharacterized protein n=1 Tax=Durusdinium trenchii TaxID=1381693 RepID=A0ABP0MQT0_9DINO
MAGPSQETLAMVSLQLSMGVVTGPEADNQEEWYFELWTEASTLKATNDGIMESFQLVEALGVRLSAPRAAPASRAEVALAVAWSGRRPRQLQLWAPVGFIFVEVSCLRDTITVSSQVLSCTPGSLPYVAALQLHSAIEGSAETVLLALAPASAQGSWLLRSLAEDQTELGWAKAATFPVAQMEKAMLTYGGIPSSVVHVAVSFQTSQTILSGGVIEVVAPAVYGFSCDAADGLKLFFAGLQSCETLDEGFRLMLNQSVSPGSYAFLIGMRTPSFTPYTNLFDLLLKDLEGKVVDARLALPGPRLIPGLTLDLPVLTFARSQPGSDAEIRVTLKVVQTLDPLQVLGPFRSVQIAVPERFTLIVREPVTNYDGLPTPEVSWYHLYFLEKLVRVDLVADGAEEIPQIPAKDYRLGFKAPNHQKQMFLQTVRLPEFWMPSVNVWTVSLCRDLSCSDLITSLPMAGFEFGDPGFEQEEEVVDLQPGHAQGLLNRFNFLILIIFI